MAIVKIFCNQHKISMEYPGSHLTKVWRRALLITCFVLFFILFPVIVMYSAGYRYDWNNGLLRETGSISVDVKPTNAKIFLNDVEIKESIPVRLNNITPRKYLIKITAPGYYDWQKEIEVKNKQTTYIKEISLLKNNEPKKITNHSGKNLALSADGRYLAYYAEQNIWVYDHKTQTEKVIVKLSEKDTPTFDWSKNKYYLAIAKNDGTSINIIDIETQKQWSVDSPDGNKINKYEWQLTPEPEMVFGTSKKIYVARPNTQKIIEMTNNKYLDWKVENGVLWTLQTNTTTNQISIVKDTLGFAVDLTANIVFPETMNIKNNNWILQAVQNNTALLKKADSSGMLIINNNKYFNINGSTSLISKYNSWWLIWTPWELLSFSEGTEPTLLNRSGEQLQKVWPLDEYNTLALIWDDKATIFFPYYDVGHILVNKKILSSAVESGDKILYYSIAQSEKEDNGIWELEY